jgi:hypothetical protein
LYAYLFIYAFIPFASVIHGLVLIQIICTQKYFLKNQLVGKKATAQIGTTDRAHVFNAGLLARSKFASGRSFDWPTRSRFSVVFLGPRVDAELVPKFHVALHALHEAPQW